MNANEEKISERVIGCAFAVSNGLGTGFLESVYENALAAEMHDKRLPFEQQKPIDVFYREQPAGHFVADFAVDCRLIVEIKAISQLTSKHEAQLMNYLRATGFSAGLLLNFGTSKLGITRRVRGHDDRAAF
jgi:GxxExxY protein